MSVTKSRAKAPTALLAAALVCSALLVACGGGTPKVSQVAVRVDKDEITVSQINGQLSRLTGVPADQADNATREIIGRLVDQQLFVQKALEKKLDRDPQVLDAIESARASILAQAYVQRTLAPQAKATDQETRKYYVEHPALFAERKVYRIQELLIQADEAQQKELLDAAPGFHTLKQVADHAAEKKLPMTVNSGVRPAEQLPLAQLPQIAQLKGGAPLVFVSGPGRVSALEVAASEPQPVDEKTALPAIEQFLANGKREQLVAEERTRLRATTKIEYVGDYAKFAPDAKPAAAADKPAEPEKKAVPRPKP